MASLASRHQARAVGSRPPPQSSPSPSAPSMPRTPPRDCVGTPETARQRGSSHGAGRRQAAKAVSAARTLGYSLARALDAPWPPAPVPPSFKASHRGCIGATLAQERRSGECLEGAAPEWGLANTGALGRRDVSMAVNQKPRKSDPGRNAQERLTVRFDTRSWGRPLPLPAGPAASVHEGMPFRQPRAPESRQLHPDGLQRLAEQNGEFAQRARDRQCDQQATGSSCGGISGRPNTPRPTPPEMPLPHVIA